MHQSVLLFLLLKQFSNFSLKNGLDSLLNTDASPRGLRPTALHWGPRNKIFNKYS